jgi:hypothetical protein
MCALYSSSVGPDTAGAAARVATTLGGGVIVQALIASAPISATAKEQERDADIAGNGETGVTSMVVAGKGGGGTNTCATARSGAGLAADAFIRKHSRRAP